MIQISIDCSVQSKELLLIMTVIGNTVSLFRFRFETGVSCFGNYACVLNALLDTRLLTCFIGMDRPMDMYTRMLVVEMFPE